MRFLLDRFGHFEAFDDIEMDDTMFFLPLIIFSIIFVIILVVVIINIVKFSKRKKNLSHFEKEIIEKAREELNIDKEERVCEYCGTELKEHETKCPSCGAKVRKKK